jgi:four helix bundle protein
MATLSHFEELDAWQKARELTRAVYRCTASGEFTKDRSLCDQIRRASVSVMSNIAEGFERGGSAEFVQFLGIAKGSLAEVEAQLIVAADQGYISPQQLETLRELATTTRRLVAGLMRYLNTSGLKGQKSRWRENPKP